MANLADTATALDEIPALGVLGQRVLEPAVLSSLSSSCTWRVNVGVSMNSIR
jgi:hypothetical protein